MGCPPASDADGLAGSSAVSDEGGAVTQPPRRPKATNGTENFIIYGDLCDDPDRTPGWQRSLELRMAF
jgi:hypothetical protein